MGRKPLIIKDFQVNVTEAGAKKVSCNFSSNRGEKEIWFEVQGLPENSSIKTADAFFAPCLLLALKKNVPIVFDVPISESISIQASELSYIFATQLNLNRKLKLSTPNPVAVSRQSTGAITGFSAGVDSWFSLKKNYIDCHVPTKRLTHLLVNDVGANNSEQKKQQVLARAREVAMEFNLGLISVRSNVNDLVAMSFERTHTARNASVAHLLTSVSDNFYYSSSNTYDHAGVFKTNAMGYADSIILPLLSTDSMSLRSTGSTCTRAEKIREILSIPSIGERLDVCVNHNHKGSSINCGFCWKCCRTELVLETLNVLDQFEPAFDLEAYKKRRSRFLAEISTSNNPMEREAFQLAREAGLAGPLLLRKPIGFGIKVARQLKRALKTSLRQKHP